MITDGSEQQDVAIRAEAVRKHYPGRGPALDGFDLMVASATVHGLLGPNGAGKTTAVRILATLARLDSGRARVAGHDVTTDPAGVRARIGLAGQHTAVDEVLSGRQNLEMFARLHRMRAGAARLRAAALLERFDLQAAADRPAGHYSGGMRRRLDLAVSLIRSPEVLFLDEPTTGLDPRSRSEVWSAVRELAAAGTTVLLTTQYLEEADRLCTRISLMERGRVVAEGSPAELKSRVGGSRVEIVVPPGRDLLGVTGAVSAVLGGAPEVDPVGRRISFPLHGGAEALIRLAHAVGEIGLDPADVSLRRPDLDEVFLHLTDIPDLQGVGR
ncbi:ATP-binding cassette domain-containing protein [Ornithinimicrobium pratense]|uniref:ATP-binding cassette domain-containing protein n=1 Tax=Ornithinimicrobium pratense TaxID=2593973 RepID=A0A5J6V7F2_9MICO|nr:ATP-binding cassette domain-containing protein [Ornithinimicrobium pratense]QFG69990.1 ATP-binding cassette domain-containing protein [Ornithinimicrobium pratense]